MNLPFIPIHLHLFWEIKTHRGKSGRGLSTGPRQLRLQLNHGAMVRLGCIPCPPTEQLMELLAVSQYLLIAGVKPREQKTDKQLDMFHTPYPWLLSSPLTTSQSLMLTLRLNFCQRWSRIAVCCQATDPRIPKLPAGNTAPNADLNTYGQPQIRKVANVLPRVISSLSHEGIMIG